MKKPCSQKRGTLLKYFLNIAVRVILLSEESKIALAFYFRRYL